MDFKNSGEKLDPLFNFDEAYKDLNNPSTYTDIEFDEPIKVSYEDYLKTANSDVISGTITYETATKNQKAVILFFLGSILLVASIIFALNSISFGKSVEFTNNGMKDTADWERFIKNCQKDKNDSIIVKIYKKDKLVSEEKRTYKNSKYTYGNDKTKYTHLIDVTDTVEDLDIDLRFIVLSNKKYTFNEIYSSMYDNTDSKSPIYDYGSLADDVANLQDTFNALDKTLEEKSSSSSNTATDKDTHKKHIQYSIIYYY